MMKKGVIFHVQYPFLSDINTFAASYLNTQGLNNSCLKTQCRP